MVVHISLRLLNLLELETNVVRQVGKRKRQPKKLKLTKPAQPKNVTKEEEKSRLGEVYSKIYNLAHPKFPSGTRVFAKLRYSQSYAKGNM